VRGKWHTKVDKNFVPSNYHNLAKPQVLSATVSKVHSLYHF